jgi:hypothetical protein
VFTYGCRRSVVDCKSRYYLVFFIGMLLRLEFRYGARKCVLCDVNEMQIRGI